MALPGQSLQQLVKRGSFDFQHVLEVGFQMPIFRQQVVEVSVQKSVRPNELEQRVQKKPCVFHVFDVLAGIEQLQNVFFVVVKQMADQLVFGGKVIVQIARADVELGRNEGGRHIGFAIAIEQVQRHCGNALGGAAGGFFGHELFGRGGAFSGGRFGVRLCQGRLQSGHPILQFGHFLGSGQAQTFERTSYAIFKQVF